MVIQLISQQNTFRIRMGFFKYKIPVLGYFFMSRRELPPPCCLWCSFYGWSWNYSFGNKNCPKICTLTVPFLLFFLLYYFFGWKSIQHKKGELLQYKNLCNKMNSYTCLRRFWRIFFSRAAARWKKAKTLFTLLNGCSLSFESFHVDSILLRTTLAFECFLPLSEKWLGIVGGKIFNSCHDVLRLDSM